MKESGAGRQRPLPDYRTGHDREYGNNRTFRCASPIILKALHRDPARTPSILLTTVTAVVEFASFLRFSRHLHALRLAPYAGSLHWYG